MVVLQDVTLTAGFGLPSDGVATFGQPVPLLETIAFCQAEASR